MMRKSLAATAIFATFWLSPAAAEEPHDILNVSYDVSRELYADIDKASSRNTRPKQEMTSPSISRMAIEASPRRSGRSPGRRGHLQSGDRHPGSVRSGRPCRGGLAIALPQQLGSLLLVAGIPRARGNPKNIKDWSDLVRDDVKVVFPNQEKAKAFVRKLFANMPVFTLAAVRRPLLSSSMALATCL
jgi:sulfate transport system substrate-binding protein